jgi:hypothetical protein
MRAFQFCLIGGLLSTLTLAGCGGGHDANSQATPPVAKPAAGDLEGLARWVLREPTATFRGDELRAAGPEGLAALLTEAKAQGKLDATLDPLIDRVAGQRYARHSRLYWYTDLEKAKARARDEHKPILSLRMLGDLRDDLSCANSRFFRVVLYPDPNVSAMLRARFVLHWSSERPVPKVTVDYGDGRKLVRTVTGNSIHYVLDENGRVIDAIPGLMEPMTFFSAMNSSFELYRELDGSPNGLFKKRLFAHHTERERNLLEAWKAELAALHIPVNSKDARALDAQTSRLAAGRKTASTLPVPAAAAVPIAIGKGMVERRLVPVVAPLPTFTSNDLRERTAPEIWTRIAERHEEFQRQTRLSRESRALMRELSPRAFDDRAEPVALDEAGFEALVTRFEKILAVDTQRNRLELSLALHQRLAAFPNEDFQELNRWVYSTVFLTPRSDPWLGLTADGVFTALPSDGIETAGTAQLAPERQ